MSRLLIPELAGFLISAVSFLIGAHYLSAAVIYHSIFNLIVQSDFYVLGLLIPAATCVAAAFISLRNSRHPE